MPLQTAKRRIAVEPFLTAAELCERWRISAATVTRLVQDQKIWALRIGRQLRFTMREVERFERFGERKAA